MRCWTFPGIRGGRALIRAQPEQHVRCAGREQLPVGAHPRVEYPRRLQRRLDPRSPLLWHARAEVDEQPQRSTGASLARGGIARVRDRRRVVLAGPQPLDRGVELARKLSRLALARFDLGLLSRECRAGVTARHANAVGERIGAAERLHPQLQGDEQLRRVGNDEDCGCLYVHASSPDQVASGLSRELARLLAPLSQRRDFACTLLLALARVEQLTPAIGGRLQQRPEVLDSPLLALDELRGAAAQLGRIRGWRPVNRAVHRLGVNGGDAGRVRVLGGECPDAFQLLLCLPRARVGVGLPLLVALDSTECLLVR